ncbi:MAG: WD40 repeat domain-containing protein, partial [Ilumatobacteraceae bacterium]
MTRFPRATSLLAVACLAGAACASDDDATPTSAPATAGPLTVAPVATAATGTAAPGDDGPGPVAVAGLQRWGDGRALGARYDPAADRTVVATTIGVSLLVGDAEPVVLHEGLPVLLALSADGSRAAFTTAEGSLEVWDLDEGAAVATYEVPADGYTSLQFGTPDDVVAAGPLDVSRFPAAGGSPEVLVEAPADGQLGPVAIATDGTVAVPVNGPRSSVVVWQPDTAATAVDMGLADGTVLIGVVWSPDARHLVVLHQPPDAGEAVAVWDVADGEFVGTVAIPNFVTPDEVAWAGPDRVLVPLPDRLAAFDLEGDEVDAQLIPSSDVSGLDSSGSGDAVLVTGWDGLVRRWAPGSPVVEVAPTAFNLVDVSVPSGADQVLTVDHYGTIRRLDGGGDGEVTTIDRYAAGEANTIDVSPDGADVAVGSSTGAVHVVRTSDGNVERELDRPQGSVAAVAYAPVAPLLATGLGVQVSVEVWDDTVDVTDLGSGTTVTSFGGEEENVTGCSFFQGAVDFSPDGTLLAASSHDYTVHVTSIGTDGGGDEIVLAPHLGSILDVEFSPDGALLATSSEDGSLRIWDVDGWTMRDEFTTTAGGYWALAFTPDGSALA